MTRDKRKRLSIYDLFGRSSSDNAPKSNPQKVRPKSLSAIKSTPIINQKTKHGLTFTLPEESITDLDASSVPLPKPRDKRSSLLFTKTSTSESSNNSSQIRISSPVSPVVKNTLPMDQKQNPSLQPLTNRTTSGTSLTSSVYPSSRNVSNSTIDFSRQTSSIYPPSTVVKDTKPKAIIKKRTDLMSKRKPPVSLSIRTESMVKSSQEPNLPSPKMKTSATDSYESSDGEFTPLQLMSIPNEVMPLSSSKQLNSTKNVMFESTSGVDYEPPSFKREENENSNVHKHSRTLSSIEEITSALEKFQMEHERSFQETENSRSSYGSNTTDDRHTIDIETKAVVDNLNDSEGIYLKVEDLPQLEEGEKLDEYIEKLKSSPAAHVVTEKPDNNNDYADYAAFGKPSLARISSEVSSESDIFYDSNSRAETPKLAEDEVFQEDVLQLGDLVQMIHLEDSLDDSLRTPTDDRFDKNHRAREETLTDEINANPILPLEKETSSVLYKRPSVEAFEVPESLISDFNYDSVSFIDDEEDYSKDDDLIGPLNKSFDSYVAKVRTRDSKLSDINSNSIVSGSLLEMDDGDWKRYDSATTTNFFHPAEFNDHDEVASLSMPQTDLNQYDNEVVTPTEQSQNEPLSNPQTPGRVFDLENELEDNLVGVVEPNGTGDSINELYPCGSSSDENDIDDDDDDDDDDNDDDDDEIDDYSQNEVVYGTDGYDKDNHNRNNDKHPGGVNLSTKKRDDEEMGDSMRETFEPYGEYKEEDVSSPSRDDFGAGSHSVLEFSPQTRFSFESSEPMNKTPEVYRGGFQFSDHIQDAHITGTPTDLHDTSLRHFVIANDTDNRLQRGAAAADDVDCGGRDNLASSRGNYETIQTDNKDMNGIDESLRKSTYDRREIPIVKPIEHTMVVAPVVPLHTSHTLRLRRPPPNFPSTGRRSRALSESTKDPELFMNGFKNQGKFDDVDRQLPDSSATDESFSVQPGLATSDESVVRKGEKCTYIESLRNSGKRTVIPKAPSLQIMPLSIKQNGKISHKKIPSVQLLSSYKSKHIVMKPKTRMLANEIDDGELPDATLVHSAQKTKVPIHPDADVIEASEQLNKLAKKRSGDLARNTSVMSVRPHYGAGMRLFVTNPDGDDD